jgi:Do/DeqQ family serine protease
VGEIGFSAMTKRAALALGAALPFLILLSAGASMAQDRRTALEKTVPLDRSDLTYSYSKVVKRAAPAVVNVYVQSQTQRPTSPFLDDPFFRRFFGEGLRPRQQSSLGSGVIVSPDGIVVTNNHVVRGEGRTDIKIALADNREFSAKVIVADERTDLAILRIDTDERDFPYLSFADSDALEVGDIVLAIGNPFGVGQTVTSGIVSALARTRLGISDYQFFIQTDAAINPGNSGGALVDMHGKLVGINTAIYSRSGGSMGIGFSIPSNMARVVVNSALRGGKVERPWLGAELQGVTSDIARSLGLDRPIGAMVVGISKGSPADKAGLAESDVILSVDGQPALDAQAVLYRITTKGVGERAELTVLRNRTERKLTLDLVAAPETVPRETTELSGSNPFAGATVANLSPAVAEELSMDEMSGVVVIETEASSMARRVGLRPGDIIVRINDQDIQSVKQLKQLLQTRQRAWELTIRRGGEELQTYLRG